MGTAEEAGGGGECEAGAGGGVGCVGVEDEGGREGEVVYEGAGEGEYEVDEVRMPNRGRGGRTVWFEAALV